ncbi:MAG: hypothetical protein HKN03_05785 [Acidimicrobiales bacterium]|nr:hypothetical protein [Acidimicrobiales bacterium]
MTLIPKTLASHLEHLAADADDIVAMLTVDHDQEGDIHPEALAKSERLQTSLREVIRALTHHDRLAMKADDVWAVLSVKHEDHDSGVS